MNYPKTSSTSQKRLSKGDKWKKRINKSLLILEPLLFEPENTFLLTERGNPHCQSVLVREYYTPRLHKRLLVGREVGQIWVWDSGHHYWVRLREHRTLSPAMRKMYIKTAYPMINVTCRKDGIFITETICCHRLMAAVWCPNDAPAQKTQVDHLDGDKDNYCQWNLEWVTPQENIRRAVAMRRARKLQNTNH